MRDCRQFTAAGEIAVDAEAHPVWRLTERQS